MNEDKFRIVLCGASAYDKKYYFNKKFDGLPENVKEDLHVICVLFTEEVGGVFTIGLPPRRAARWSSTRSRTRETFCTMRSAARCS